MADPVDESPTTDLLDQIRELPPEQQANLIQEIMAAILGTNRSAG